MKGISRQQDDSMATLLMGGITLLGCLVLALTGGYLYFRPEMIEDRNVESMYDLLKPMVLEAISLLKGNQFCQALAFSSITYYAVYIAGFCYRTLLLPLFSAMSSSVVIHNTDPNFNTIIDYLAEHMLSNIPGSFSSVQASTKKKNWTRKDWIQEYLGTSNRDIPIFDYRPDNDNIIHRFQYKGQWVYLSRSKSGDALMGADSEKPFTPESLTLTVWGSNNQVIRDLMSEALESGSKARLADSLNVYIQSSSHWINGWELALTKKARPKDSVILDVDDMEVLLDDARRFLNSSAWYIEKGIPYRRGYMLYGPPGCGKTSFAQVLAGELKLDICMLNLTHAGLNDNDLCELLRDAPSNSVIVLEDIDAVFVERDATGVGSGGRRGRKGDSAVSFSGLLNAIDGVASQEGKIFFMTTNHIEKLDAALIRPGRCDVKFEVKHASKQQMEKMFLRFYPGETVLASEFAAKLPANELSMASLQGHFLNDRLSPQEAVEKTSDLLQSVKGHNRKKVGTVADCLFRLGLERYSNLFYFRNCKLAADMCHISLDDLLPLSMELKYDPVGQKLIKDIIASDKDFILNEFSIATVSEIRSAFLSAYPTSYERETGEKSPFFRRHTSHLRHRHNLEEKRLLLNSIQTEHDLDKMPEVPGMHREGSTTSIYSISGEYLMSSDMPPEELDGLCQLFCEELTRNGKGAISQHNLKSLLSANPNRPAAAVESAKHFVCSNSCVGIDELNTFLRPMSLYNFLKRAGLAEKYFSFFPKLKTISELKEMDDLKKTLVKEPYNLSCTEALCLFEILNEKVSETGNLLNFSLYDRSRIMNVFMTFYSEMYLPEKNEDEVLGKTSSIDVDEEKNVLNIDISRAKFDPVVIERLAFQYAVGASTSRGFALVSTLEVLAHLKKHVNTPETALTSIESELLHPVPKTPPPKTAPPPAPKEWIESWLENGLGNGTLAKYAKHFVAEGIKNEEDLRIGGLIDESDLKDLMMVKCLGDRRKIIRMQEDLLEGKA